MTVPLVVLLRGVNIGGKRIEMASLRALLEGLGFDDVRTYVQSGNVVLRSPKGTVSSVGPMIEQALEKELGLVCRIVVRTVSELDEAIEADPLLDVAANPSRHLVVFLSETPAASLVTAVTEVDYGEDQIRAVGRHMYLWCPNGVSASPFFKIDFDRKLEVVATNRNWNTVLKLADMARA